MPQTYSLGELIQGHWQSVACIGLDGSIQKYNKTTLDVYSNGTGKQHAKTLFFRNRSFTWHTTSEPFVYTFYELGGPGDVTPARLVDLNTLVVGNGFPGTTMYEKG